MPNLLDSTGNPIVPRQRWYQRAYSFGVNHYIASAAAIAGIAALITNIERIATFSSPVVAPIILAEIGSEDASIQSKTVSKQSAVANRAVPSETAKRLASIDAVLPVISDHVSSSSALFDARFATELQNLTSVCDADLLDAESAIRATTQACRASRACFLLVLEAATSKYEKAEEMASDLDSAQERAIAVISRCRCETCNAIVASVRRRQSFVAIYRRTGTLHSITKEMLWLAKEL